MEQQDTDTQYIHFWFFIINRKAKQSYNFYIKLLFGKQ